MKWYWITLLVIAYLVIGAVCAGIIANLYDEDMEELAIVFALAWPIVFPIALIAGFLEFIYELFL